MFTRFLKELVKIIKTGSSDIARSRFIIISALDKAIGQVCTVSSLQAAFKCLCSPDALQDALESGFVLNSQYIPGNGLFPDNINGCILTHQVALDFMRMQNPPFIEWNFHTANDPNDQLIEERIEEFLLLNKIVLNNYLYPWIESYQDENVIHPSQCKSDLQRSRRVRASSVGQPVQDSEVEEGLCTGSDESDEFLGTNY